MVVNYRGASQLFKQRMQEIWQNLVIVLLLHVNNEHSEGSHNSYDNTGHRLPAFSLETKTYTDDA